MATGGNAAQQKVTAPAIALLVTAIIGIITQIVNVIYTFVLVGQLEQTAKELAKTSGTTPATAASPMLGTTPAIFMAIIGIIVAAVMIMGALKMKKLESFGLAFTSSILAMIPCVSPCCILGLPIGIWAVVVLSKPDVKSAFH